MVDLKLEELIKQALEDKYFGRDKVVVETDILGNVKITEYEQVSNEENDSLCDDITDLENQIYDLEDEISLLKNKIKILNDKLKVYERLVEILQENDFELYVSAFNNKHISVPTTCDGLIDISDKDFKQFEENDLLETSVSTLLNRKQVE